MIFLHTSINWPLAKETIPASVWGFARTLTKSNAEEERATGEGHPLPFKYEYGVTWRMY